MIKKDTNDFNELYKTNEGYFVKVIKYSNYDDVVVEIQDEYKHKVKTGMGNVKKGKVRNPYHRSIYGRGYLGVGKYKSRENYNLTNSYKYWKSMLERCYDELQLERFPTYIDCEVSEEWLNYQNFAKWYDENYYEIPNEKMRLDKDILIKGNKIYNSENCAFVPERINLIFGNRKASRGSYPIGVSYHESCRKFRSRVGYDGVEYQLGNYDNYEDAFLEYKINKEEFIRKCTDKYKEYIPKNVYEALMNWEIEIID